MSQAFIKKIDSLKNFGSFENFTWPNDLSEFQKVNLFYGRNGSGKTTLSQFFQCLEAGEFPAEIQTSPSMEISTIQGKTSNLNSLNRHIKVFNVYYIKNNVSWDDGRASNLLWLGKIDIDIQTSISVLESEIEDLEKHIPEYENVEKEASNGLEEFLKQNAKQVRTILGYPQTQYQRPDLEKDLQDFIAGKYSNASLTDEIYSIKLKIAHSQSAGKEAPLYTPQSINLKELVLSTKELLEEKLTPAVVIDALIKDPALKRWVESGLEHHHEPGKCKFCNQPTLSTDRLNELKAFFDDKQKQYVAKLKRKSDDLIELLNRLDDDIENVPIAEEFKSENKKAIENFNHQRILICNSIKKLNASIEAKQKNLFSNFDSECKIIDAEPWNDLLISYEAAVASINNIRKKHNDYLDNFDKTKRSTQRDIELQLASELIDKYILRVGDLKAATETCKHSAESLVNKKNERAELKGQISSSEQAAEFINKVLQQMGHIHIRIEYDESKQAYSLLRGGVTARRLSEGEKTAIAFAHFVASLQEENFRLDESILVIDDPISSLDATASYFIYGLVKSLESRVSQLFLMTHSHSFFVMLLKDWRGKNYGNYEIKRIMDPSQKLGYSKIISMEKTKITYYTEYNYLFSELYEAAEHLSNGDTLQFDRLYNLMNCARKLVETFLGFKFPDKSKLTDKYNDAIKEIEIDIAMSNSIFKVINFGSHANVDGFIAGSGLDAEEMANCVHMVLEFIKLADQKHFEGMVRCQK